MDIGLSAGPSTIAVPTKEFRRRLRRPRFLVRNALISFRHGEQNGPHRDPEKWNQMIFEQANKKLFHQDTLRWALFAGFALFFLATIAIVNDPKFLGNDFVTHDLQFVMVGLGTIYLIIVMIESWYYNLYLAHLNDCEQKIAEGRNLIHVSALDRREVASTDPAFLCVLCLVIAANSTHLWQATNESTKSLLYSWVLTIVYSAIFLFLAIGAHIPRWIDRSNGNRFVLRQNLRSH